MAQKDAAPEFLMISISKAELVVRMIEAATGIPRPAGIDADEIFSGFQERSPIQCRKMEASAEAAVIYFTECMKASIPETTMARFSGVVQ